MPPLSAALLSAFLLAPPALPASAVPPLPVRPPGAAGECAAVGDAIAGADARAARVLRGWEEASAGRTPVSRADRAAAAHRRPGAPAELLTLAAALAGPIDADALTARYRWTAAGESLHAVPADPLVRVFTPRLTVALAGGAPRAVTATVPDGPAQTLALAATPAVRRAAAERDARPPVRGVVRTALLTKRVERRPTWRLDRRIRRVETPAPRAPLTAPRPR